MKITDKNGNFIEPDFKINKPLTGRRFYINRLMIVLGRTFWQVNGVVNNWSESMFQDALAHCEQYSNIKMRNIKFKEYVNDTKVEKPIDK